MIPDQTIVWNKKHGEGDHEMLRGSPSPLAEIAEPYFQRQSNILELGCGVGRDAVYFASKGHNVLATDSSDVVIGQNKQRSAVDGVEFALLDIQKEFPYEPESFDVVYANLALHYYSAEKTRETVASITQVLKTGGVLAFACKSKDEARTNGAKEVEDNVFVAPNGRALHLFSVEYARQLVADSFEVLHLDEVDEEYGGRESSIVRCIARMKSVTEQ